MFSVQNENNNLANKDNKAENFTFQIFNKGNTLFKGKMKTQ